MALVAGVLRRFLLDRDELPDNTLVAMVPVSVHDKSDRPGRNQVSGMFSKLETNIEDPAERLKAIADANSVAKQHSSAIGATLLQDWSQFAAPAVFGVAMRVYAASRLTSAAPVHNLVVSNVPGPQVPLYFLGARGQGDVPARPDLPRLGAEHHRDVAERHTRRRPDLLPRTAARSVGHGRRLRASPSTSCSTPPASALNSGDGCSWQHGQP